MMFIRPAPLVFLLLPLLGIVAASCGHPDESLDELTVRRINIVDGEGKKRMVLAANDRFPLPVLDGREFPRDITPSGIVFYDNLGNEVGGMAVVNIDSVGEQVALAFDYQNSEALGLVKFESEDGKERTASLELMDRQPLGSDIMKVGSVGTRRISLTNTNGTAQIVLRDTRGRARITLAVDSNDQAHIEMRDTSGKVVQGWPAE